MSLGEMLVTALVALLVMKPQDIPSVLKTFYNIKSQLSDFVNGALSKINSELKEVHEPIMQDIEELNFYLRKIIELEGSYEGDYSKESLKAKYQEVLKSKIEQYKSEQSKES